MNNLKFLFVALLLTWSTDSQQVGMAVVGPLTKVAFKCLANDLLLGVVVPFVIVRAYKVSGTPGIDPYAVHTLQNVNAVSGYAVETYMQICRGMNATNQVNELVNGISSLLYDSIWIKVEPNNITGCSWDGYTQTQNCIFLTEAIQAIVTNPDFIIPGIFTTPRIWNHYFGTSCDSVADLAGYNSLWYADYDIHGHVDSTQSFQDFVPFGGWIHTYNKQVGGNLTVTLCGNPKWHARIDLLWSYE